MLKAVEDVRQAFQGGSAPPNEKVDPLKALDKEYLTPSTTFSAEWLNKFQEDVPLDPKKYTSQLFALPDFDSRTRLRFKRTGLEGTIQSIEEYTLSRADATAAESLDMSRQMGSRKDFVRGRSGRLPFTPGGLEMNTDSSNVTLHSDADGLYDVAPSLTRGMAQNNADTTGLDTVHNLGNGEEEDNSDVEQEDNIDDIAVVTAKAEGTSDIDSLLPEDVTFMRRKKAAPQPKAKVWAHMVDINQPMQNFEQMVPNPARTWPFELDNFQKEAVYHLEQGDSVFVAAHTSAGKTVIAEYAMSMAEKHMTKCIYTSPIKALSNQKYRDFSKEYGDVGILTGDVQLNPEATTLIMTTEILRSMLYRGADIIRDVEFIIFDEVHYVNDSERGVVWEEVIIMLPDHVKFILLSATVPNTFEFANWVGRTKQKNIYVISTPKRPVPLKHFLWAKKELFEIVDEDRKFSESGYKACCDKVNPPPPPAPKAIEGSGGRGGRGGAAAGGRGGARGGAKGGASWGGARGGARGAVSSGQVALKKQGGQQRGRFNNNSPGKSDLMQLAQYLSKNNLLPAVVFVFSRKLTEQHAMSLRSLELNNAREKSEVHMFIDQAVSRLRKEDRDLPQILMLRELLANGIGVHHSGLLPIMKEVVEILFARGLVKILFATETFAMGLNLPTRTVVFAAIRKFDSKAMRFLTPGEYTQMAGRAGRRGLDKVGTVIIMQTGDEVMPAKSLQSVILGTPTKLSSQFRLTYTMILSLLRIEALRVEDVIQQSFSENATQVLRPEKEKQLLVLQQDLAQLKEKAGKESPAITEFIGLYFKYRQLTTNLYQTLMVAKSPTGNFCLFKDQHGRPAVGVIFSRRTDPAYIFTLSHLPRQAPDEEQVARFAAKTPYLPFMALSTFTALPQNLTRNIVFQTVPVSDICFISDCRFNAPNDASLTKKLELALAKFQEIQYSDFGKEIKLDGIKAVDAQLNRKERAEVIQALESIPKSTFDKSFAKQYPEAIKIATAEQRVQEIQNSVTMQNTDLLPDYEQRVDVLKEAHYVDDGLNVLLKGRVACEISTGFELYVTELLLDNFLANYEPEEIVALLSVFVFEGARGVDDSASVTPKLDEGKKKLLDIVEYVNDLCTNHQIQLTQDEAEFAEKGRFALMQAVYEWAKGMSFYEITQLTPVQEGTIVRVISRLDEVCRAVMSAARIMGDVSLYDKVATAQERIKRDIVFCSSLYL